MSDALVAALLGLVQGLTEFLPVSSTAHLIVAEKLFRLDAQRFGLAFDVAVHLGTALAVLIYFAGTWISLARDVLAGRWRLPALIVVGTVPAAVIGVLLESEVESTLRDIRVIVATLIAGSVLFYVAERVAAQRRAIGELGPFAAFLVGAAQALALLPGMSRSGSTISAGLLASMTRVEATRFSFLLATPIILGAGAKTLLDARHATGLFAEPLIPAIGFAVAFLSGLAAVAFMLRFLRANSLNWFTPYRLLLALVLAIAAALGVA